MYRPRKSSRHPDLFITDADFADDIALLSDSLTNAQALLSRGLAFKELGELKSAARAFLNSYTDFPESDVAPQVMFRLGQSLVDLGQIDAGCQILSQVQIRFPDDQETDLALNAMNELQCQ